MHGMDDWNTFSKGVSTRLLVDVMFLVRDPATAIMVHDIVVSSNPYGSVGIEGASSYTALEFR